VLRLVIVRGFLVKMLANDAITRFLRSKAPEFLDQFEGIVATQSIDS
jgi:hypothetical protein